MATNSTKKAAKTGMLKASPHNGWSVLAMLVEGVLGLFNSNKIYPAFGLLLFLIAGLVVWRLPDIELAIIVKLLIEKLSSSWGLLVAVLIISNSAWFFLFRKMRGIYNGEIERISAIRQELMHGGVAIKSHRSSDDAENEMYILPSKQGAPE